MKDYGIVVHTKESVSSKATTLLGQKSPRGTLLMSFKLTVGRTAVLDIDAYHNEAIISICIPLKKVDSQMRSTNGLISFKQEQSLL